MPDGFSQGRAPGLAETGWVRLGLRKKGASTAQILEELGYRFFKVREPSQDQYPALI